MESGLSETVVVLVEPSGPINVGSIARLCVNFGVSELRLVAPKCDPKDKASKIMAISGRGEIVLNEVREFSTLIDALADCRRIVATCGRIDHGTIPLGFPEEILPWLLESYELGPVALVFGREDRGLTNDELQLAHKVLTLHSSDSYRSLNLSHAVAVTLHELNRIKSTSSPFINRQSVNPANPQELEEFLGAAKDLLLEVGFLLKHSSNARMSKVRALLQRAETRTEEVALLRGMIRQIKWAINSRNS